MTTFFGPQVQVSST